MPKPAKDEKHVNFADQDSSSTEEESEEEKETSSSYSERESSTTSESSSAPSQKLRRSKSYTAEDKKEHKNTKRCRSVASLSSSEE